MKNQTLTTFSAGVLVLAALDQARAQYTPPQSPSPFPGFINEYMSSVNGYTNHWNIGGVDRERYVAYEGYGIAGLNGSVDFRGHGATEDNQYLLSRIRFHVGYSDEWWTGYVEGQSSLAGGDRRVAYADSPAIPGTVKTIGNGPEDDSIDLHQGYFTAGNTKEFPLTLKVGRQELSYGEERLVGSFDWNNIGRSFDAAKLRWQQDAFTLDALTGMPVVPRDGQFDLPNNQEWFSGVYGTITKIPTTTLETYFFARNVSRTGISQFSDPNFPQATARDVYTIGGRLVSKPGALGDLDYMVDGAYQFGDFCTTFNGPRLNQNAFMFIARGGYTLADLWAKPRVAVEYDYGSGDGNSADGSHGTFDNLYPTNHKFYGNMDLFSLQNLQDIRSIFQLKPTSSISLEMEGNVIFLADTHDYLYSVTGSPRTTGGYGINPGYDNFVGTEITLVAGYAITAFAMVEAGYGHFFAGKYVEESQAGNGGARDADFAYVQTTLKF